MRITALVPVVMLLAVACGSDEEVLVATTTTTLVAVDDEPSASEAPEATGAPEPSVAETASPTAPPTAPPTTAEATLDSCLVGSWMMKQDSLDIMAATAVPFSNIQIPSGGMTLNLNDDGTVATDAKFTAVFSLADTTAEADVFWAHSGTWSTQDGVLTMVITAQEAGITEVRQAGFSLPGPIIDPVAPLNGGPYQCSERQLIITTTNGSIDVPMNFER